MTCNDTLEKMVEWLRGELSDEAASQLEAHCATCPACAAERDDLLLAWNGLADLEHAAPSPALRQRFDAMLSAYESGIQVAEKRPSLFDHADALIRRMWPARPVWQLGLALGALILGLTLGGREGDSQRLQALETQIGAMQQMVAMTLETATSSTQRLEVLSLAARLDTPSESVIQSLMTALSQDPSTNVRLAAVEALSRFANRPSVRQSLAASVQSQPSPLVQAALVNLMAQNGQDEALRSLLKEKGLNPDIRDHAQRKLDAMI